MIELTIILGTINWNFIHSVNFPRRILRFFVKLYIYKGGDEGTGGRGDGAWGYT